MSQTANESIKQNKVLNRKDLLDNYCKLNSDHERSD